ncbi:hypothetical protein [Actinosynnema sp. NPDC023587]|uniref:hypothetical protein n=1 Tax=Actinosynnema sp. NPDC023587 TaxID=3154695 RepID=UPI00340071BE
MTESGEARGRDRVEGGDPVCWLSRVCPECGHLADGEQPAVCPRCGAAAGGSGDVR